MTSRLTRALAQLGRAGVDKLSASFDSWENNVTGFGTGDDKTTYTRFMGVMLLSQQELSNLYHGDDLAARMVDVVPDEMLREGFTVDLGDVGLNTAVADKLEELSIDERLANGIRWGRGFGEGAILIGADDGRSAWQPLIAERARDINYLHVMDGRYYWPLSYYREAGHPKLGQPETFGVMSPGYSGQPGAVVHESRLIRFGGAPTADQEREVNQSRDYSVLQRAYEALRAFNTGFKSVELLLTDGHQSVFKMQGLAEMIGSGGEAMAAARLKVINLYRSVLRAIVVDAGDKEGGVGAEDFTRNSVSFSDIPKTLDSFMLRLAAAVQIPVTILMGQSPAGMNATGESDFRWFYDRIRSEQTRKLAPKIRRLMRVLLATKNWQPKKLPAAITIKFPALWTEPPLTAAQTRKTIIEGDTLLTTNQIVLPEEVALQRLRADGYSTDLVMTPEGVKVREAVIGGEYSALTPDDTKADIPDVELAPTDAAAVLKVNEARASMKLPPLDGPDGELTLSEFAAKSAPSPGGFGGGGFGGGPPKFKPAAKPSEGGALPSLAQAPNGTNLDADDYERDEAGRFAETGGGGGASGGGSSGAGGGGRGDPREQARKTRLAAVAKVRLQKAEAKHAEAKTEHEAAKQEAHAALDAVVANSAAASEQALKLVSEAKAEHAQNKAERKALDKRNNQLLKESGHSAQDIRDHGYGDKILKPSPEHAAEFKANKHKDTELSLHNDAIEEHISGLKREARENTRTAAKAEKARAAVESSDVKTLSKLEESGALDANDSESQNYIASKELRAAGWTSAPQFANPEGKPYQRPGQTEASIAKHEEVAERFSAQSKDTPALSDVADALKVSGGKLARAERAVKVHEREVKRREKQPSP